MQLSNTTNATKDIKTFLNVYVLNALLDGYGMLDAVMAGAGALSRYIDEQITLRERSFGQWSYTIGEGKDAQLVTIDFLAN